MPRNSNNNDGAIGLAIFIAIITIGAIIANIIIGLIHLARFGFWISLILIPTGFIVAIIFFFKGLNDDWDREDNWIIAGVAFVLMILFFFLARGCYNMGYSDNAIKTEIEMKGYLEWYDDIMSIFDIPENVSDQAITETINSLCQDPNYPCDNVKQTYSVYKEVKGMKDLADEISTLLLITK